LKTDTAEALKTLEAKELTPETRAKKRQRLESRLEIQSMQEKNETLRWQKELDRRAEVQEITPREKQKRDNKDEFHEKYVRNLDHRRSVIEKELELYE